MIIIIIIIIIVIIIIKNLGLYKNIGFPAVKYQFKKMTIKG